MHKPEQLPILMTFMLFTFVVMAGMSYVFAKWMKRHKQMEEKWLAEGRASHVHDQGHHH